MEKIDQKIILDELLSGSNISQYMAFAYNLPAQAVPDDPSWVWPQLWSNPWLAMAVYTDMEEKDGMLSSVLESRKENVLSKARRVIPASQKRQDIKVAEFIEETLESYFDAGDGVRVGLDHILWEAMDAQSKGVSIGETIYANAPDRIFIKNVMFKPQHLFGFGEGDLAAYSTSSSLYPQTGPLRLRPGIMLDNVTSDKPLPEYKFFVYSYRPRYSNRWGSPIDRRAYWASWFKRASLKQWLRFLEKGPGSVVARYNDGAAEDEQNKALDAARAVNEESAVALARKFQLEVLQHVRQSMGSAYKEMVDDFCNNEIARIVLGQTLTSRGSEGGGSRALGEVHERVGDKKTEVDAKGLMLPVNTQLVWPLVLLNFGPNTRPPLWMIDYEPGADLTSMQKWLEGLHRMRLPMSKSSIYSSFPVNAPESEEDTLPAMSAADAASAPDGENDPAFAEGDEKKKGRLEIELRQAAELEDGALSSAAPLYDETLGRIISDLERLRDLREAARPRFFEKYVADFDPLSEVLGDALLASYLLALNQFEESKSAEFDDPIQTGFELPPERAIDYFRRKGVVTSKEFRDMTAEARAAAFTVGGVYRTDVLDAFKEEIAKALEQGTAQRDVVKQFRAILTGTGHRQLGAFHLETIFRTNMQIAYGTGRRQTLEEVIDDLPLWEYHAVLDDRTRPAHAALDGMILPADHQFWSEHFPPCSWHCRCTVLPLAAYPENYNHSSPNGEVQIIFNKNGSPVKAESGGIVYDLAVTHFKGIPAQPTLRKMIDLRFKGQLN